MVADVQQEQFSEIDLNQSICRESFWEFVQEFWDTIIPEIPVWNWHIPFLCHEMQAIAEQLFKRKKKLHDLIVNIPPGTTKSTIISIMFPAWMWTRDPSIRIICASFEQEMALDLARKSRDVIMSDKYQETFRFKEKQEIVNGRLVVRWRPSTLADAVPLTMIEDQNAKGHFANMAKGERKSIGVGGMITGRHAHIIITDDPLNPREAVSDAGLKDVNRWWDETLPSRKVDKAVTPTILVMQRLHQNDPTGHWLEKSKDNLRHICLPAEMSDHVSPKRLIVEYKKNGGLLDPRRLNREILAEARNDLGKYGYAGQFDQTPIPQGGGQFEVDRLRLLPLPPMHEFEQLVRYWDKGGSKGKGARTAGALLAKRRNGETWILDVIKGQWAAPERERTIRQTAELDNKPDEITYYVEQEPGSGGKESAETTIGETLEGYNAKIDIPRGPKETRAEPLAGQMGVGRVCAPKNASWLKELMDEMRFFPYGKFKDQVDACSGAYGKLNNAVKRRWGAY